MTDREFTEQIKRAYGVIYNACNTYYKGYDRDDLLQDILISIWLSLKNFNNKCAFTTWAHTIARNVCISKLNKKRREPIFEDLEDYKDIICNTNNYCEIVLQLRQAIKYETAMNTLDEADKSIFEMYIFGLSYKEISQQTGISENALTVKIFRINKRLKLRYGNRSLK